MLLEFHQIGGNLPIDIYKLIINICLIYLFTYMRQEATQSQFFKTEFNRFEFRVLLEQLPN